MTDPGFSRRLVVCAVLLLAVPPTLANERPLPVMARAERAEAEPYAPSSVLVRYRPDAAKRSDVRAEVRSTVDGAVTRTYHTWPSLEAIELGSGIPVETAITRLRKDPRVLWAEPNYRWGVHAVPNDEHFDDLWGLDNTGQSIGGYPSQGAGVDVDAPEAWEHGTGSADVVVADLDEGCDYRHPDLAANMWTNTGEIAGNGVDDDANGFIDDVHGWDFLHDDASTFDGADDTSNTVDFHGTHTSGTIGAVGNNGIGVAGVCWTVRVMTLKFLEGVGDTDDAVAAIDYALDMKTRGVNLRAINCSWGGSSFSQALADAIASANAANVLVCVSSGNGGSDGLGDNDDVTPSYPASYDGPNIISVGAWTRYDLAANFSNYGATTVDLMAPGGLVASTGPNGSYYFSSGTSMAAPHVTGAVALIASLAPSLSAAQIKAAILETTVPVPSAKPTVTGGRLNLRGAVEAALEIDGGDDGGPPPPPPVPPPVVLDARYSPGRKTLIVDGLRFTTASSIELDGVAMPVVRLSSHDLEPDGSYIRISGKAPGRVNDVLPKGRPVTVTVYDAGTGQRSAPLAFTRTR